MSEDLGGPRIINVEIVPISLSRTEGWFKTNPGNYTIILKQLKNKTIQIIDLDASRVVKSHVVDSLNCDFNKIVVSISGVEVDICRLLEKLVNDYALMYEAHELLERAKAAKALGFTMVPRPPNEYELLISNLTKTVLSYRIVKTFYFYEGSREVVLGIYCYENGYYRECEDTLKYEVTALTRQSTILDSRAIPTIVGNVIKAIEHRTLTKYEPMQRALLFKNKVFSWDMFIQTKDLALSLIDPSPDIIITHRIPWEIRPELYARSRQGLLKYVPPRGLEDLIELFKGLAPKSFKAFLSWVKSPEESEDEALSKVVLLLEIIGYTLYPHEYPFHKAVLLVGGGSNGKSTYLRLIETILSKQNVSSVNLTDLDPRVNRFASSSLHNKLANISSEPVKSRTFDPTLFKMLTGEDLVFVERKSRDGFTMYIYAKLIFSANELPQITEDTYAFWRRWIVIEFPNTFPPDPEFFDRTFTPEEGIIICALHAFRLVLERKDFTVPKIDVKDEWISRSNPVYRIVKKMIQDGIIEIDPNGAVVKADLYALYKKYIEKLNEEEGEELTTLEQKDFTRHLTRLFPVRTGTPRIGGKKRHAYIGVKIKNYVKALELLGQLETPPPLQSGDLPRAGKDQ